MDLSILRAFELDIRASKAIFAHASIEAGYSGMASVELYCFFPCSKSYALLELCMSKSLS